MEKIVKRFQSTTRSRERGHEFTYNPRCGRRPKHAPHRQCCRAACSCHMSILERALGFDVMTRNMPRICESANSGIIAAIAASRSDLLRRVERWTYGRKIKLCTGLSTTVIAASEVILAHGLTQDEIDRWMEAYKKRDFEALKVGYAKKRRAA